jgi:hypothetical protein
MSDGLEGWEQVAKILGVKGKDEAIVEFMRIKLGDRLE